MKVNVSVVEPGGNNTLIIHQNIDDDAHRRTVSQFCIDQCNQAIEQVGYVEEMKRPHKDKQITLTMMGGELCINAVRSLAAAIFNADKDSNALEVQCADNSIRCRSSAQTTDARTCHTVASFKLHPEVERIDDDTLLVNMPGISHFVSLVPSSNDLEERGQDDLLQLMDQSRCAIKDSPAVGAIFYQPVKADPAVRYAIRPIVHVRDTETTIEESACGSGSIALAIATKALASRFQYIDVVQPRKDDHDMKTVYTVGYRERGGVVKVSLESAVTVHHPNQEWSVPDGTK